MADMVINPLKDGNTDNDNEFGCTKNDYCSDCKEYCPLNHDLTLNTSHPYEIVYDINDV